MNETPQADNYNALSKFFHWLVALLVLSLLGMGFFMGEMEYSPLKLQIFSLHKSFGLTVLWLVALRIVWRAATKTPPHLDTHAQWEIYLSKFIHFLLYCGLLIMPLSGWAMSSAGEFSVNYFWLFEMPDLTQKDEALFDLTREIHEIGAYILYCAIGLHFLGAAKHHFIDKDSTLRRMGGNILFLTIGALFLLGITALIGNHMMEELSEKHSETITTNETIATESLAENIKEDLGQWTIFPGESYINFTFNQYDKPIEGTFANFDGTINFDPGLLDNSTVQIEIDITSIETGSDDRDNQAKSKDWFDTKDFPKAVFESESFTKTDENQYIANGFLTIRGNEMPLNLPFFLEIEKNDNGQEKAIMRSEITLQRLDFGVGQGQWESTEAIDNPVQINIQVSATR